MKLSSKIVIAVVAVIVVHTAYLIADGGSYCKFRCG